MICAKTNWPENIKPTFIQKMGGKALIMADQVEVVRAHFVT
jgi:hypothetical protein